MRKTLKFIASAVVALGLCGAVKAADFTHDFNTDPGAIFGGNARWVSGANGYVSLTDAINSQSGKMLLPDFDLGGPIEAFTATMKIRIDGSTCCGVGGTGPGGTIQPADGMSFNFANADDPAVANLADGAAGFVASAAEEGTTTGLSVCIDTWDNAGGEAPNIDIKANGVLVATARVAGNIFRNPEGTLTPRPILPLDPRTPDLNWAPLEISLSSCGGVTVKYKGVTVFDEVPTGITPRVGRFLMGGRTGGANDNHWVDDLAISTVTDSLAPVVSAKVPSTRFDVPPTTHIGFTIQERLNPISMESIVLTLDGTAVTPTITSTGDEGSRAIVIDYLPPAALSAGADHTAVLEF